MALEARKAIWINKTNLLGKNNSIIAHFPDDSDIDYIMMQARNRLPQTSYSVQREYQAETREMRWCLAFVREEVERVAGRRNASLLHSFLVLDKIKYTWEDGQLMAGQELGIDKLTSMYKHDFREFLTLLRKGRPEQQQKKGERTWRRQGQCAEIAGSGAVVVGSGGQVLGSGANGCGNCEGHAEQYIKIIILQRM